MLRVGIIGLGTIAPVHLAAIRSEKDAQLVAACDLDTQKEKLVPEANFYQDAKQMLSGENLDVVHLCLPHYLHVPMALLANAAGVNVLTEKPLGLSAKDGERLLHPARPELKIAVCFQNRYNNTTLTLKEVLVKEAEPIRGVRALVHWHRDEKYYQASPWRGQLALAGSGSLSNQAIHTLDLMQLFGGPVAALHGAVLRLSDMPIEVEDTAVAKIDFVSGAQGYFNSTNVNANDASTVLEVDTDNFRYVIRDGCLSQTPIGGGASKALAQDDLKIAYKRYYGPSHGRLIHDFYQSIENDTHDYVSVKEALVSMRLIDALYASSDGVHGVTAETKF